MAVTDALRRFAFIALGTTSRAYEKGQNDFCSALLYSHQDGAQVARQRCPILRLGDLILSPGLSSRIGHFYFGENRTFLLWVDKDGELGWRVRTGQ